MKKAIDIGFCKVNLCKRSDVVEVEERLHLYLKPPNVVQLSTYRQSLGLRTQYKRPVPNKLMTAAGAIVN